jgi:hypothetical protein
MVALLWLALAAVPPVGAQHRVLDCTAGSAWVSLSSVRVDAADGGVVLVEERATLLALDAPEALRHKPGRVGKPKPGCAFPLPLPSAAWSPVLVQTWTALPDGRWSDGAKGVATLSCESKRVKGSVGPTAFVVRPGVECADSSDAFRLTGGEPREVEVLECAFVTPKGKRRLRFGVGAVVETIEGRPDDDCYWGSALRVVPLLESGRGTNPVGR